MKQIFTKWSALVFLIALGYFSNQNKVLAQTASQYGFTAVSGTYTPITGGTAFTAVQSDDVMPAATIPLNFSFTFCGVSYTSVRVCSNGLVTFSTTASNTAFNDVTSFGTIKPALMWLWDDLDGATGAASYTTTGTAPNRVFTFEFKNWEWYWNATGPNISCQVKLYETTNVIEYVYNQESQPGTPNSASIGIVDGLATPTYLSLNNSSATPTASSTTFTTSIASKPASGQIYRFTPPPNCSAVTTWPASATTTVSPTSVCVSQNVTLTYTPATALPAALGVSYQWQSAPAAGGPWTTIGTSTTPSFVTLANAPLFYRCQLMCNTSSVIMTASATAQLVVNNPGTPTVTGATRCGPGTLTLSAAPPAGSGVVWYAGATGGLPLATTNNYTTPYLPGTTTFYAAASSGTTPVTAQIGTATTSTAGTDPGPFGIWFRRSTMQFLYTGAEITAAGGGGGTINSLAFNCTALPAYAIVNYTVKVKTVPSTMTTLAAWQTTGMTTVYNIASYVPAATGWQTLNFTAPIPYSTGEGIVVELCWDQTQPTFSGTGGTHQYTNTAGRFLYAWEDNPGTSCGITGTTTSNNLPNVRFGMVVGCEGPRQPVTATITPGPALNIAKPAVVCSGEIGNIAVTSTPMTNYTNYTWTPNVADLYTNAGATTPYTTGSAPNVYFKSTDNGAHTYYLFSSGATPAACTHADTFSIWVQPDSIRILGLPDTICVTGSTVLTLSPSTGYAPNTIQWQESANGGAYNDIPGATGVSYTTPTLTTEHYYRALIKSTNTTCEIPVKHVIISNAQLLGVVDSFNCGPGTVTLNAVTGGNGSAVWYTVPTGGAPVGFGVPFVTPSIDTTTNYYVSAAGGTQLGTKVLGAGALTSGTQTYNPFCSGWGGTKMQYLITAAELLAAGVPAGATITSLGMDVVTGGTAYPGFAISMKNTTSTALNNTFEAGTTGAFPATNVTPTSNALNNYIFGTAFPWDGTSNLLIQMCWSNGTTNSTGNTVKGDATTFVAAHRGQSDSQTPAGMCGLGTGGTNGTYSNRPKFTFGYRARCETPRQLVHAYIRPKPSVDLGQNINICVDTGSAIVLDAGVQPNNPVFLWDNTTNSQVRAVNTSGTYHVTVTNQYGCVGSDTVNVLLRKNPVVRLGNDTSVCNGVTLTLNPGGGSIDYFWSTGQTSQTIDVNTAGSYSVFVTNAEGCMATDTIQVMMQGELPTIAGIQIANNGQRTFHFTAVYPQNVIGYDWNFGDGSLHSYEASPSHVYEGVGDYVVVLRLSSTCGFAEDTVSAHIVGVHELKISNDELMVYPNPSNGQATILNKGDLKMEKIEIYNILGQVVYRSAADAKDKHVINLGKMASGIYTVEVYTDKGTVARKLEVIR